jgi:hypothetical protein
MIVSYQYNLTPTFDLLLTPQRYLPDQSIKRLEQPLDSYLSLMTRAGEGHT